MFGKDDMQRAMDGAVAYAKALKAEATPKDGKDARHTVPWLSWIALRHPVLSRMMPWDLKTLKDRVDAQQTTAAQTEMDRLCSFMVACHDEEVHDWKVPEVPVSAEKTWARGRDRIVTMRFDANKLAKLHQLVCSGSTSQYKNAVFELFQASPPSRFNRLVELMLGRRWANVKNISGANCLERPMPRPCTSPHLRRCAFRHVLSTSASST